MPWLVLVDTHISLLRSYEAYSGETYFSLCQKLAEEVVFLLVESVVDCCISIVKPSWSGAGHQLSEFSKDVDHLVEEIRRLSAPNAWSQTSEDFTDLISWALRECFRHWGPSSDVKFLIFTTGDYSSFCTTLHCESFQNSHEEWSDSYFWLISLTNASLSQDLMAIHSQFASHSRIIPLGPSLSSASSRPLMDTIRHLSKTVLHSCCPSTQTVENTMLLGPPALIMFGRVMTTVRLVPELDPPNANGSLGRRLSLEVFGFMHASDLSNPPVSSRHLVTSLSSSPDSMFLPLLLASMQETKTVAVCVLYLNESDSEGNPNPRRVLWRYGFIHQFDTKTPVLLLSVFHTDCPGLPWLGQFEHLAPVADFAGSQLYNDAEGSSPFPVRVPDRLSYGTNSLASIPESSKTNRAQGGGAPISSEPIRYVSWVSPASLSADVNKVLRLGRRLPEKANLFFKELGRVKSTALAYGCPELLTEIARLTLAAHEHHAGSPAGHHTGASQAVQGHLKRMTHFLKNTFDSPAL
ncbi:unnamed protein product [Calicophoron daubneyi]|uniref:Integrator complex subunit 14 C-terminal domain-containing protein n=1 Tax=Calicophoron daubneyi TaxID=300641 RepID=A0AAV2U2S3_CALDB